MMSVQIGKFGTLEIGHKTGMGKVSEVMDMGNSIRKERNLRPYKLDEILRTQDIWEFIIERYNQFTEKLKDNPENRSFSKYPDSVDLKFELQYSILEKYKDKQGFIQYSKLIRNFPNLIKSKRGKNGGTWAELYILLKIASKLDKKLEVEIYRVFIEEHLLSFRDLGGDNYKRLNIKIDTLSDRKDKNNQGIYINIAKQFRQKLEILNTKGYNEKEHNILIQETRARWLDNLISMIDVGFINSYKELQNTLGKLK